MNVRKEGMEVMRVSIPPGKKRGERKEGEGNVEQRDIKEADFFFFYVLRSLRSVGICQSTSSCRLKMKLVELEYLGKRRKNFKRV